MTHTELNQKYNLKVDPCKWMAMLAVIPREWKIKIKRISFTKDT